MKDQVNRLKYFFQSNPNRWIPLPDILRLGIAQYDSRILDLRRSGLVIENNIEVVNGEKHSFYRYIPKDKVGQLNFLGLGS